MIVATLIYWHYVESINFQPYKRYGMWLYEYRGVEYLVHLN